MGVSHFDALGITLLLSSSGRYASGLAVRSVLRTHSHALATHSAALMHHQKKRHFDMHPGVIMSF